MRKITVVGVILLLFFVCSGCSAKLSGSKPPNISIKTENEQYDAELGTYCWTDECVDTVGTKELLNHKEPIQVEAGEQITLHMDFTPKPNEIHLSQIKNGDELEIRVNRNQFIAPGEKGTYFYAYSCLVDG